MGYHFTTIGLGPVLLAQGRYVRRVTPRLPEPEGLRQGVEGSGPPLRLLILGDSSAAGVGVATQGEALSGQLVAALAAAFRVSWKLVATSGLTSAEVLARLEAEPEQHFDVVVTATGVNDVTGSTGRAQWLVVQQQLVELLKGRFRARHILLSSLPPLHHFPALPQPLRWYLGLRARRLNRDLRHWAQRSEGCTFVPIDFPMDLSLMASDGFHPGAGAYALWASQLAGIIHRSLEPAAIMPAQQWTGDGLQAS